MNDNMFVFDVHLTSLPLKGNVIRITDGNNNLLFEERINAKVHRRRYEVERSVTDKIYFQMINRQLFLKELFLLNHKVEEKWEVVKG